MQYKKLNIRVKFDTSHMLEYYNRVKILLEKNKPNVLIIQFFITYRHFKIRYFQ
jgi:hypothetical protein